MSSSDPAVARVARRSLGLLISVSIIAWSSLADAQQFANTRSVGGVLVNPAGILTNADMGTRAEIAREIAKALQAVPDGLDETVPTRKVSLKGLEASLAEALSAGTRIPDAVLCLGGLQKIDYVLVSPDENDIFLIGPAEAWTVDDQGAAIGATSGRPVMLLDDLIVALRAANVPQKSVISCSIDPTPEGLQRLRAHAARLKTIGNPRSTAAGIENQLGPQAISVTGVPDTSHFAHVLVAADYRMKRVSMGLEPSPVAGLPSFMAMMKSGSGSGMRNMLPRWWLAPDYEPLLRDEEGLTWQLRKGSVKAMAENDFINPDGTKQRTGQADPISQRWAKNMTDRYDDLAKADPIFGQLRNCMDMAIVGALLVGHQLPAKAELELPLLMGSGGMEPAQLNAPKQVASKASLVRGGRSWTIACGGVQINPWQMVYDAETSEDLADVRSKLSFADRSQWWSN